MNNFDKINYCKDLNKKIEKIKLKEENFVVIISENIKTKEQLLYELKNKFNFPSYFGNNWDALNDVLSDLYWIDKKNIHLFHARLPQLNDNEQCIYLEILINIIEHWEPFKDHALIVYFSCDDKQYIEKLLKKKEQI